MASLADIRSRLAAQENKSTSSTERSQSENAIYPHWNIADTIKINLEFSILMRRQYDEIMIDECNSKPM